MLRHLLDHGWIFHRRGPDVEDPDTGRTRPGPVESYPIRAALQRNELLDRAHAISDSGSLDDRILIVREPITVGQTDYFTSPAGETWLCVSDGMKRHRPGRRFRYTAVTVRRAEERDG